MLDMLEYSRKHANLGTKLFSHQTCVTWQEQAPDEYFEYAKSHQICEYSFEYDFEYELQAVGWWPYSLSLVFSKTLMNMVEYFALEYQPSNIRAIFGFHILKYFQIP